MRGSRWQWLVAFGLVLGCGGDESGSATGSSASGGTDGGVGGSSTGGSVQSGGSGGAGASSGSSGSAGTGGTGGASGSGGTSGTSGSGGTGGGTGGSGGVSGSGGMGGRGGTSGSGGTAGSGGTCAHRVCDGVCCEAQQVCGPDDACCTPDCSARMCGDDPVCGTSCGLCSRDEPCIDGRCHFPVLTLNMMGLAHYPVSWRLAPLRSYLASHYVPIVALQEGGVSAGGVVDIIAELHSMLGDMGVEYTMQSVVMTGNPLTEAWALGVLSKHPIVFTDTRMLRDGGQNPDGWDRLAFVCGVDVPDYGRIDVYSLHLGSDMLQQQAEALLQYIDDVADARGQPRAVVLAGDFNLVASDTSPPPVYTYLTTAGYIDTYRAVNTDLGPTYGIPGNPYGTSESPIRIDYIFVKGAVDVLSSAVEFDTESEFVSDHSAVVSALELTD